MTDFKPFAQAVKQRFDELSKHELFVTLDGDTLWEQYLAAFPAGTNPIFRERTEHDCSCCRNFVRNVGNVVAIIDGKPESVWQLSGLQSPYDAVAARLHEIVITKSITGLFRTSEPTYGAEVSHEAMPDGKVRAWNHFHARIAQKHFTKSPAEKCGEYSTTVEVFRRGLEELTIPAITQVIDLAQSKAIYRGEEFVPTLMEFLTLKRGYEQSVSDCERNLFLWSHGDHRAARFRNTVIGTLVQDLCAGVDLEAAVKSFETKVAPTNYKRTTALITPRMIQNAMKTINELGMETALERRMARLSDVSVNNVLWVDNAARAKMKGGLEGLLLQAAVAPAKAPDQAEDISIEDFMANILPTVTSMEAYVQNSHMGNFMTLTAPVHPNVFQLFKWDNNFAWSYDGNITDSIKERVKKAGGSVTGDLCCRLAWDYKDDLDLHMHEPNYHIYFGNRSRLSPNGGTLDVDANGGSGMMDEPVENIFYKDRNLMQEGIYRLRVNNYTRRSSGTGFIVEIEFDGQTHSFNYGNALRRGEDIEIAQITYSHKSGFSIRSTLPSTQSSKDKWGVKTEQFTKVNTLMFSPNHWDGNAVGNKHYFFLLDGCANPEPVRGIYNEFLAGHLDKHRKVFEVLGDKTKCQPTDDQLSGVGFSSTRGDTVLVNVTGPKIRKTYRINF